MICASRAVVLLFAGLSTLAGLASPATAHETAFPVAVCACEEVDFNGTIGTDSFDSREGPYDPVTPGGLGDVASNGDVTLAGTVHGDVTAGGNVTGFGVVTGDIVAGGTVDTSNIPVAGTVFQKVSPAPVPCACEDGVNVAQIAAEAALSNDNGSAGDCAPFFTGTDFVIGGTRRCTLPPGRYYLTLFRVLASAVVIISPSATAEHPVELVFDGAGPFAIGGTGIVNATERAQSFVLYSASAQPIDFHGTTDLAGLVHAPRSSLTLGTVDFYGAVNVGVLLSAGGTSDLHYDEASLDREDYCASDRDGDGICDDDDPYPNCGGIASSSGNDDEPLPLFALVPLALALSRRRRPRRDR